MNKESIVESLHGGVCKVTFEKADGTVREMNCTLHHSYVPEFSEDLSESKRESNPDVVPVWDTDAGGWRSFRIDRIKEFKTGSTLQGKNMDKQTLEQIKNFVSSQANRFRCDLQNCLDRLDSFDKLVNTLDDMLKEDENGGTTQQDGA